MNMNQKGFANIFLIILVVVIIGVAGYFVLVKKSEPISQQPTPTSTNTPTSATSTNNTNIPPTPKTENASSILSELQRLNIEVTGTSKQIELELPPTLSDANWGMKKIICEEGGYNLSAYAGKTLLFTSYPISELWNNTEPLNVWVATSGNSIACVYKTVRENSNAAPGIFSVKKK